MPPDTPTVLESPELKHFLTLANAGYDSSGTVAARELADCAVNNVPCLDGDALRGFVIFTGLAKAAPETARQLLED